MAVDVKAGRAAWPTEADPTGGAVPVTVAFGDGIGPEIMGASLKVLLAARANLVVEPIGIGEQAYRAGHPAGITAQAWDSLRRTRAFYKAPLALPQDGHRSLSATLRNGLGLFATIRPCASYAPVVPSRHPGVDLVIVRENEADLCGGIESRLADEVSRSLKLFSRFGCERVVRYAFAYARADGRRKVTCLTRDDTLHLTDGLFRKVFDRVAADYPDIANEHGVVDSDTAVLAGTPGAFDVLVLSSFYGDILSDMAEQAAGSAGLVPSASIGEHGALFEAVHGAAPALAGQDVANPSGLLLAGIMMLVHIGQPEVAARVHNAWLRTLEDGVHTRDIHREGISKAQVGTMGFADAVIARLGEGPSVLPRVTYRGGAAAFSRKPGS